MTRRKNRSPRAHDLVLEMRSGIERMQSSLDELAQAVGYRPEARVLEVPKGSGPSLLELIKTHGFDSREAAQRFGRSGYYRMVIRRSGRRALEITGRHEAEWWVRLLCQLEPDDVAAWVEVCDEAIHTGIAQSSEWPIPEEGGDE